MSTSGSRPLALLLGALTATVLLLAGCSDGGDTVAVSGESDDRPSTSVDGTAGDASAYCATAAEVSAGPGGLDLSQDATAALAGIEQLADRAPEELADDFRTFLDGVRGIADLGEDDPDSLSAIFELMTDPEFEAAADAIEQYTADECGIELGAAASSATSSGGSASGSDDSEPGEIELADVDAVKEENASAAWSDKLATTFINGLADVQVASSGDDLTSDEAIAACSAMLESLSAINPEVTVAVANGEDVVVRGADGTCAAA